jgi:hypothetical protein
LERRTFILKASLLLNAALLIALLSGYGYYRFQQFMWNSQAFSFAVYAGTMQCISDHDHGIQRIYRVTVVTGTHGQSVFTGERDHGVEVWSWPLYSSLGEAARVSNNEFVNAYNRRMQNFMRDAATRPAE